MIEAVNRVAVMKEVTVRVVVTVVVTVIARHSSNII